MPEIVTTPAQAENVQMTVGEVQLVNAVSPRVTLTPVDDGTLLTVEDVDGIHTATIYNGEQGEQGPPGQDGAPGVSPTATVTQTATGATLTVTDGAGTTTAEISNGEPGTDGTDGVSPTVSVTSISGGHEVSITDASGTQTFDVMDGAQGPSGAMAVVNVSGSTPTITGADNTRYICGEVSTLSITAPASGCIDVTFTSGSTPTVLTVTSAKSGVSAIKWANGFDSTSLEADTVYEINILDGEYGVSGSWT